VEGGLGEQGHGVGVLLLDRRALQFGAR
jgi:hypothetical protein